MNHDELRASGRGWNDVPATLHIQRVAAKQAHYVPPGPRPARGPFDSALFDKPRVNIGAAPQLDSGEAMKRYRCNYCGEAVFEDFLDHHVCPEYGEDDEQLL